jgi:hypothetical protein
MKRIVIIATALLISIGTFLTPNKPTWAETTTEQDANFVFYAPGLSNGRYRTFSKGWGTTSYGLWNKSMPYAWIVHVSSGGGYTWDNHDNIEEVMNWINGRQEILKPSNWGSAEFIRNKIGAVDYKAFNGALKNKSGGYLNLKCIAFSQMYDGNNRFMGVYCDRTALSNDRILEVKIY